MSSCELPLHWQAVRSSLAIRGVQRVQALRPALAAISFGGHLAQLSLFLLCTEPAGHKKESPPALRLAPAGSAVQTCAFV